LPRGWNKKGRLGYQNTTNEKSWWGKRAGQGYNNPMRVKFTKMHGLGNDFVVLDAIQQSFQLTPWQIRQIADRHFGVGCDQLLLVEPPTVPDADFRYRIFNADGGEVEQCGNGARCFVRFVHDKGLARSKEIRVQTAGGMIFPRLEENGLVTVNMGAPRFDPPQIPFVAPARAVTHALDIGDVTVEIGVVSMGNPHAVQVVPDVDAAPVVEQGEVIGRHPRFPQRVNAGFMQVMDRHSICLRVFERGAGETLACGTGACAAVVSGIQRGLLDSPVKVQTRGGELNIAWQGDGQPVMMTGPAVVVFEGEIEL
jgi:diaminopimelate epimerase